MPRRRLNPLVMFGGDFEVGGWIVPITGSTFYTHFANGSDSDKGDHPETALKTQNEALDRCTSGAGDAIIITGGTETVTETVAYNKTGVTVQVRQYGGPRAAMGEYVALLADPTFTDGPVATFTAPTTVSGLGFISRDTGSTFWSGAAALIGGLATASPYGVHLHKCRFPKWGLSNRIGLSIEGSSDVLIDQCEFEGVTQDFESGIYLQGAAQNIKIHNNIFSDCDYALTLGAFAGGGPYLDFYGNTVIGADSKGVDTQANTGVGVIRRNNFNTAPGNTTYDRTVSQIETQGWICIGNEYAAEDPGPT
ncbi:MAG: right-handed parallel beta-helix repeat-containing protein [Anaerolineales bacterium]|nr:right-handed parallel beta-helix repeat-containing protein [Anaerolineales bacterium]